MSSILLVEDSPTQAMQMRMLLESACHQVTCCDDGTRAIEHLQSNPCELVVTDLELPLMNGLELIKQMQCDFPHVPTVLVTGQGSERLAAEALRAGATAYVPKSMLDDMLLGTITDVLGVLRTDRSYSELIECTVENRLVFELPNRLDLLITAIDLTMQLAAGMQLLSGADRFRVWTALQHAASNAIYRGNLELSRTQWQQSSSDDDHSTEQGSEPPEIIVERQQSSPYRDRKVHYDARLMRDLIRIVIRDEGRGFDTKGQMEEAATTKSMSGDKGRGLVLMRSFMDKVTFNASGNEVTLIKQCIAG